MHAPDPVASVVVTGASGHLGGVLVRALLASGARVRAVYLGDDRALAGLDVERVVADVTDAEAVRRAVGGASLVLHLAAVISIDGGRGGLVDRVNVGGTRNVAAAARAEGVRMVHVSSIHAFRQEPVDVPLDETRTRVPPAGGHWPVYDRTKAAGERVVRAAIADGLDAVILHPTGIIGPEDHAPSRMGRIFLAVARRRMPAVVAGGFDWVDVRDVAAAILAAADPARGRRNESYLVAGNRRTVAQVTATAAAIAGVPAPRIVLPMALARLGAPPMTLLARVTHAEPLFTGESLLALRANHAIVGEKARRELGILPRPFAESVHDLYRWHRDAGNLPSGIVLREAAEG